MLVVTDVGEPAPSVVTVMCEGVPSDSEWDFVEPQSFSFSKKRNFASVENPEETNYEGTLVKAPPLQGSFSSEEEGSLWSAQERTAIARMEHNVNNNDCIKLEIDEVEDCSLGPEYSDVDVKHTLRNAPRECRNIFEAFSVKEKGEHLVASKWRWDDCQRQRKPQEEKAWKESHGLDDEDKRKWFAAYEDLAKKMMKFLEDREHLKVGLRELKEHLETPEAAGISIMQIAKQARNERGQKLFQIFRQEENEVYIASLARSDAQLRGIVELERRCQELMQEMSSERQGVLAALWKTRADCRVKRPRKYCQTIFEEMREFEEKKSQSERKESENVPKVGRVESDETLD